MEAIRAVVNVSNAPLAAVKVVVFLAFKSQVYLPWLARSQPARELSRALRFYLPDNPCTPEVTRMLANRLAQNRLMQRFYRERGIPLIDTTDALTKRFTSGENVYFPDESSQRARPCYRGRHPRHLPGAGAPCVTLSLHIHDLG